MSSPRNEINSAVGAKAGGKAKAASTDEARLRDHPAIVRRGVAVSSGLVNGVAHLLHTEDLTTEDRALHEGEVEKEISRFRLAIRRSRDELSALKECLNGDPDDPAHRVLEAHQLLLDDVSLLEQVRIGVEEQGKPAAVAFSTVLQTSISALESADTEYFRGRSADLRDVQRRVLRHLVGDIYSRPSSVPAGAIIVANELSPTDAASFDPSRIAGLVIDHGGATSHAAILARARGIPAVVGLVDLSSRVENGDPILLDGDRGEIVVFPNPGQVEVFNERRVRSERRAEIIRRNEGAPTVSLDEEKVRLYANIETAADIDPLERVHSDGVGLFRTEFFFLDRSDLPGEEEQFLTYQEVLRRVRPNPVTIRAFDVGGDKFRSLLGTTRSDNPFLGVRGIRLLLQRPELFRSQLRAILRASIHGRARILYPMISSVEELRDANALTDSVREELLEEGALLEPVARGAMIEVPAAVTMAAELANECDFLSIGSNDLIQYTLAVDRGNEHVAHLYDPFHPAVVRNIGATVRAGQKAGVEVSSCGEMSGDIYGAALLLGLGCDTLSMSVTQLAQIKDLIRRVRMSDLREMAEKILQEPTAESIRRTMAETLVPILGEDAPMPVQKRLGRF